VYQRTTGHYFTRCGYIKCRRVLVQECQEIPPRSQKDVTARVTLRSVRDHVKDVIVESQQLRPGLYVGRTLLPPNHRDLKVCVANATNKPQAIPVGSYLGQAVPVTILSDVEADSRLGASNSVGPTDRDESLSEIIQSTLKNLPLPSDITDDQRQQVIKLLRDYDSLLWSPYVIGRPYIFLPCSFFLLLFFPRLISAAVYRMSTILLHMAWP